MPGFAWFTIKYWLAPTNRFPDRVRDVEDAVRWMMKHADDYKGGRPVPEALQGRGMPGQLGEKFHLPLR